MQCLDRWKLGQLTFSTNLLHYLRKLLSFAYCWMTRGSLKSKSAGNCCRAMHGEGNKHHKTTLIATAQDLLEKMNGSTDCHSAAEFGWRHLQRSRVLKLIMFEMQNKSFGIVCITKLYTFLAILLSFLFMYIYNLCCWHSSLLHE